jgi:hypothetical protein
LGGKGHEFLVERLGMSSGQGDVACDGVLIDMDHAAGGASPTALSDVAEDLADLLIG